MVVRPLVGWSGRSLGVWVSGGLDMQSSREARSKKFMLGTFLGWWDTFVSTSGHFWGLGHFRFSLGGTSPRTPVPGGTPGTHLVPQLVFEIRVSLDRAPFITRIANNSAR